jgi:hypothetical protein
VILVENGIIFNNNGHVVVLIIGLIGQHLVVFQIRQYHVVLIMFVYQIHHILVLVVMMQLVIYFFDIQKH